MIVKLNEIKNRKELKSYVAISNKPFSPNSDIYNIQKRGISAINKNRACPNLSSNQYRELMGLKFYVIFPDQYTKEHIERIPLNDLEFKTCMDISKEKNIPFSIIASYKVFLMDVCRAIDLEGELSVTHIKDERIIQTCNNCKEGIDKLIKGCVPHEVLY